MLLVFLLQMITTSVFAYSFTMQVLWHQSLGLLVFFFDTNMHNKLYTVYFVIVMLCHA